MKTLTLYSGKLWHSDKPFPVNEPITHAAPAGSSGVAKVMHSLNIDQWLSTAYEVVNPEVIPKVRIMWEGERRCLHHNNGVHSLREYVDGDELTLPEGYGIDTIACTICEYKGNILVCHDNGCQHKKAVIKPVVEPSESQEESAIHKSFRGALSYHVLEILKSADADFDFKDVMNRIDDMDRTIKMLFTITRK